MNGHDHLPLPLILAAAELERIDLSASTRTGSWRADDDRPESVRVYEQMYGHDDRENGGAGS